MMKCRPVGIRIGIMVGGKGALCCSSSALNASQTQVKKGLQEGACQGVSIEGGLETVHSGMEMWNFIE